MQATDDVMIYANWSKGFKSGGWTTRLSQPILDGADAEFGPEIAKTTELGLKSEWLDRRLVLNAAVFYTKYQGIQLQVQQGASPVSQNAGDATIKGAELEMHAVAGNGFSLNFVGGYIDAKYDTINPDTLIPLDSKLPKTPKYKVTVGPAFEWSLAGGAKMQIGADYTRTASMFNDSLNTPELFRPATDNLNAAIHYLSPAEKYEVILGGTNLTDERYLTVGSINRAAGEMVGTYSRPREWYLTLKMKLGGE
jgi:iron complex outermembrane receptor protein